MMNNRLSLSVLALLLCSSQVSWASEGENKNLIIWGEIDKSELPEFFLNKHVVYRDAQSLVDIIEKKADSNNTQAVLIENDKDQQIGLAFLDGGNVQVFRNVEPEEGLLKAIQLYKESEKSPFRPGLSFKVTSNGSDDYEVDLYKLITIKSPKSFFQLHMGKIVTGVSIVFLAAVFFLRPDLLNKIGFAK